jgi:hypothetical protein
MTLRRISILALVAGPVVLGVACADSPIAAPGTIASVHGTAMHRDDDDDDKDDRGRESRNDRDWQHRWTNGTNQAALVWCQSHGPATASANIGPSGGIIAVGNARLILPPGALTTTVHVTATQPGGNNATVHFEPSGLEFKKPAGLQFDVSGCNVGNYTPDIVYLNDEGVIVERIEATYSNHWKQVAAPVKHFSSYALAW